jgi:purine-nucleoside phosphorylase
MVDDGRHPGNDPRTDKVMTTFCSFADLEAACRRRPPRAAVVFGSGLGVPAGALTDSLTVPFSSVPGLPPATVEGHKGCVTLGTWAGARVLVFEGRIHRYEGHSWEVVERPLLLAGGLGAQVALLTNAAGGIRPDLVPGTLMVLNSHIDWTWPWPWRQPARPSPYSPRLCAVLRRAATGVGLPWCEGVYAAVTGPCYETPAEIRALRFCGADAVGMSTAREAQAAAVAGLDCAAVSCITNRAAGLSRDPPTHEEVLATAATQRERLGRWVEAFLRLKGGA